MSAPMPDEPVLPADLVRVGDIATKTVDGETNYWLLCEDGYAREWAPEFLELFVRARIDGRITERTDG